MRSLQGSYKNIFREWAREEYRVNKNIIVMIDDFAVNKKNIFYDNWEIISIYVKKNSRLTKFKRKKKSEIVNQKINRDIFIFDNINKKLIIYNNVKFAEITKIIYFVLCVFVSFIINISIEIIKLNLKSKSTLIARSINILIVNKKRLMQIIYFFAVVDANVIIIKIVLFEIKWNSLTKFSKNMNSLIFQQFFKRFKSIVSIIQIIMKIINSFENSANDKQRRWIPSMQNLSNKKFLY